MTGKYFPWGCCVGEFQSRFDRRPVSRNSETTTDLKNACTSVAPAKCVLLITMLIGLFLVGTASANDSAGSGGAFHPFAFGYRDAQSGNSGASAWDIRIPAGFTLIKPDEDRWGLRLRLTIYAGGYDVNINEPSDYDLTFHSLAATPGVEFLVPVGKGWTLKPFTEVGYAHDFDNSLGVGVWSAGLRTIVFWPLGRKLNLGFGTKVQYLSTFTSDLDLADEFVEQGSYLQIQWRDY